MSANNIREVLAQLEQIIDWCAANGSRAGYFAALYHGMTVAVEQGINQGLFQDGPRMEQLDTIFANRYLSAWNCYRRQQPCTQSWRTAFDACAQPHLAVVQHLLLGINTHINLDLAIAAADTAPGAAIESLHPDFLQINKIIASLTSVVYDRLCSLWFPLRLLGRITQNRHEAVINFSIAKAREASWSNALLLAYAGAGAAREQCVQAVDGGVNKIAGAIIRPGQPASMLLRTVQWMEPGQPAQVIKLLRPE